MQQGANERWYRGSDRILGGVGSGLAAGLHVDPLWIRIGFVLLALVQGVGVLVYVVLWLIMPERPGTQTAGRARFDAMMADVRRAWYDVWGQLSGAKPAEPSGPSEASSPPANPARPKLRSPSLALGVIFVVVGLFFLADAIGLVNWNVVWPLVLIAIGVLLLARSLAKRS